MHTRCIRLCSQHNNTAAAGFSWLKAFSNYCEIQLASDLRCFTLARNLNPKSISQRVCLFICPHEVTSFTLTRNILRRWFYLPVWFPISSEMVTVLCPALLSASKADTLREGTFCSRVVVCLCCCDLLLWQQDSSPA